MGTRQAVVENGRISLDVDYPDGTELTVIVADQAASLPEMSPRERAELDASVERGLAELDAGLGRPVGQVIERLHRRG